MYLREYVSRCTNLTNSVHAYTLPEGKSISTIDAEELGRKKNRVVRRLLHSDLHSFTKVRIVPAGEKRMQPERVDRSSCGKNFFGEYAGLGIDSEYGRLLLRINGDADSCDYDDGWNNADGDEGEFPLHRERDDKCCHECGYALYRERQLLGNAIVYIVPIRSGLGSNGAGIRRVKEGNVLSQS